MRQIITTLLAGFCAPFLVGGGVCWTAEWPASQRVFIERYCSDCHDAAAKSGGLDFAALSQDLTDAETLRRWVRVYDRIADGEMPPPTEEQPDRDALRAFLASLGPSLAAADRAQREVVGRRLKCGSAGTGNMPGPACCLPITMWKVRWTRTFSPAGASSWAGSICEPAPQPMRARSSPASCRACFAGRWPTWKSIATPASCSG
jgi:hypothetical protein